MQELGLYPDVFFKPITDNPERILLSDLQDAMSRAVAALFWSSKLHSDSGTSLNGS